MSLVRNAVGSQFIPPKMVLDALAMILACYSMAPVCGESWNIIKAERAAMQQRQVEGAEPQPGQPFFETEIVEKGAEPFRNWLRKQVGDRERAFFVSTAERLWAKEDGKEAEIDADSLYILLPSFCVSELTKAFQIGFLVYLPFIAIDIVVSNILLAMGMMMVSPVTISLPFKLLLFVMVDGWTLLIQGLVRSYV
jgi:type III secretion protein R